MLQSKGSARDHKWTREWVAWRTSLARARKGCQPMNSENLIAKERPYVVSGSLSLALFAALSVLVVNGNMNAWNGAVCSNIASLHSPALTSAMVFVSTMGSWFVYVPVILLLLVLPKTRMTAGLPVAVTMAASELLNHALKLAFAIPRPDVHRLVQESGYGYPSGHAMNTLVFFGMCALVYAGGSQSKARTAAALVVSSLYALLMGFSRVYLGVHAPADVVAGYCAGVFVVSASQIVLHRTTGAVSRNASTS